MTQSEIRAPVRWGIIGCGDVTERKSGPAYQKVEGFELTAVMRRTADLAEDYARRHGVATWSSRAEDIIRNDEIDAVCIATPPDSHMLYALQVAEAGKPCCVEKPLAPSHADSLRIHRAFEEKGVPLFVAYYRRSLPRFGKVREILTEGIIGDVRHVTWHLHKPVSDVDLSGEYFWRTDKAIALGGYFDDLACHGLDLFAWLLGDFDQVKGVALNQRGLYSAFDSISACWTHKNGVTGIGSWNFCGHCHRDEVVIHGSEGEVSFSMFGDAPVCVRTPDQCEDLVIAHHENIQYHFVRDMRDHLLYGKVHPSTGATAVHTSWVMDRILGRIGE